MFPVKNLEIHVAHACNLKCESCSHYSDQGHKGVVSLEDAERWMGAWSGRVRPETFSLLGGEPTIHPDLTGFVRIARKHWPDAHLRIVTNGFFVHNHPELPRALQGDGNAAIYLSLHHRDPAYLTALRPGIEMLQAWQRDFGVPVYRYNSSDGWRRTYRGKGADMLPYEDGRPRQSWERCVAKDYLQLFEAKLWKCSPLAYLGMQDAKHGLSEKWKPYLAYRPLQAGCSDAELRAFLAREDETTCAMCPAQPEKFKLPMPLRIKAVAAEALA